MRFFTGRGNRAENDYKSLKRGDLRSSDVGLINMHYKGEV